MLSKLGLPGLLGITMGLGLSFLGHGGTAAQAFNPHDVRCYGPPGTTPAKEIIQSTAIGRIDTAQMSATLAPVAQRALSAVQACAQSQCNGAQVSTMKQALSTYLDARRRITTDLYHDQGTSGLQAAADIFAGSSDAELSRALAQLNAAGGLDIAGYGADREALALVALKPTAAFRPCEAVYRTVRVQGYVY